MGSCKQAELAQSPPNLRQTTSSNSSGLSSSKELQARSLSQKNPHLVCSQNATCPKLHNLYSFLKVSSEEGLDHVEGPECQAARSMHSVCQSSTLWSKAPTSRTASPNPCLIEKRLAISQTNLWIDSNELNLHTVIHDICKQSPKHSWKKLRTDPVVCPDCNIEDSLSPNMRREIAENTAYTQCFLLWDSEFSGF